MRKLFQLRQVAGQAARLSYVSVVCLLLVACAARPRVVEVSSRTYLKDIGPADEPLFVRDQASRFHHAPTDLPAEAQQQEFYVRWSGRAVRLVKFECRQVDRPNVVAEQTCMPGRNSAKAFEIRGEEFRAGGPVSAWRVSLWDNDRLLAEKTSSLW